MILFKLNLEEQDKHILGWRADFGIELSRWCQSHGLIRDVDYTWAYMADTKTLHFKFYGNPSFASLFALRWSEYL